MKSLFLWSEQKAEIKKTLPKQGTLEGLQNLKKFPEVKILAQMVFHTICFSQAQPFRLKKYLMRQWQDFMVDCVTETQLESDMLIFVNWEVWRCFLGNSVGDVSEE